MDTISPWQLGPAAPAAITYPPLQSPVRADVVIIGAGITGLTLAVLLSRQGLRTVVLEAARLGGGSTGHSTGNLYETLSHDLTDIVARWGVDVAGRVAAHRRAALDAIQAQCRHVPAVDFRRCALRLYAQEASHQARIDHEAQTLERLGLPVTRPEDAPAGLPAPAGPGLELAFQAQFHPQAYLQVLARQAEQLGARIHEHSPVLAIEAHARAAITAAGQVQADELVMATHTPKGLRLVHAQMPVHREYGVALRGQWPDPGPGIFWARGEQGLSIRTMQVPADQVPLERLLVCVGQAHPTGLHDAGAALRRLQEQALRLYPRAQVACRWSAQSYQGADGLPYIGRDSTGCFVATGFGADGLTWGTVAAQLIAEEVAGRDAEGAMLYHPLRLSPLRGGRAIVEEVSTMTGALVRDYLTQRQERSLASLGPGDSAIVDGQDEGSVAAWRSPQGELFAVSPVCTHLGCKVHWNSAQTSWDCPCHGSRFSPDGTVLEGPALAPLARRHLRLAQGAPAPGP